jgi:hypothetical protein
MAGLREVVFEDNLKMLLFLVSISFFLPCFLLLKVYPFVDMFFYTFATLHLIKFFRSYETRFPTVFGEKYAVESHHAFVSRPNGTAISKALFT